VHHGVLLVQLKNGLVGAVWPAGHPHEVVFVPQVASLEDLEHLPSGLLSPVCMVMLSGLFLTLHHPLLKPKPLESSVPDCVLLLPEPHACIHPITSTCM
jgi:hypothetical protein